MTYTTWITAPVEDIFVFARQDPLDPEAIERRDFLVDWLKSHFKVSDISAAKRALEAISGDERHYQENLLRIEYAFCLSEPIARLRHLRDGDILENL